MILLFLANFKVENVSETISDLRSTIKAYIGSRHVVENTSDLTSMIINDTLSEDDQQFICNVAKENNVGIVFVETNYNVFHGSILKLILFHLYLLKFGLFKYFV